MGTVKMIRVRITPLEMGFFRATSVDLPGLYSAARTIEALLAGIPRAIVELLQADGFEASVGASEKLDDSTFLWRATIAAQPLRKAC